MQTFYKRRQREEKPQKQDFFCYRTNFSYGDEC